MIFYVDKKCKSVLNICVKLISESRIEVYDYNAKMNTNFSAIYAHHCCRGYVVETYDERFNAEKKIYKRDDDFLYYLIEAISFEVAINYAKNNRDNSREYREIVFEKELEIFSRFGELFFVRKRAEVMKYLGHV